MQLKAAFGCRSLDPPQLLARGTFLIFAELLGLGAIFSGSETVVELRRAERIGRGADAAA
jgi:hypothetical protein